MTPKRIKMTPFWCYHPDDTSENGHSDTHKCYFLFLHKLTFFIII